MSADPTAKIPTTSTPTGSTPSASTPAGSTPTTSTPTTSAREPASEATTARLEPGADTARRRRVGWHDTDVTSLVFGLLFLGIAAVWALVEQDVVSWPDASRIFPVVLVAAGLIGLVGSLTRSRRSRHERPPV
jgi:hypothetical protein